MSALLERVDPTLRGLFGTRRPVYVSTSSATGFMEAAVRNLSRRRILCLVCGAFGARFHDIASLCGRPADRLDVEWGEPNTPETLRDALRSAPGRYDLVTVVHSETSTGVLNPVAELAKVVSEFDDVLIAVDGVSSVGGTPIEFDEWGLDFLLTGSQKALALPPGLAFATASERALERAATIGERSYYFDLIEFERRAADYSTTNTPAVSLLFALEVQAQRIEAEGLAERFARHRNMAEATWRWASGTESSRPELEVLAPAGFRSPAVTALSLPDDIDGSAIVADLADAGITIATGYGKLKSGSVRVGHMGDHSISELEMVLSELGEAVLARMREPAGGAVG